ncbi:hypothetical protein DFQ26_001407 [Actinomortierella ambigua]|nr:hypothetical protein DFQ26_001407 [Actinomortierella ambigua]
MDRKTDSDTPRSEEGHLKRPKTIPRTAASGTSKATSSPATNNKGTPESSSAHKPLGKRTTTTTSTPTSASSQTSIEDCIANARRILSETPPIDDDTSDLEHIQTLERAINQHRDLLYELSRHINTTHVEMAQLHQEHNDRRRQRKQAHEAAQSRKQQQQQLLERQIQDRDVAKADLEETKQTMAILDQTWQSLEEQIQRQEHARLDFENKKQQVEQEALERRKKVEETLTKAAMDVYVKEEEEEEDGKAVGLQQGHGRSPQQQRQQSSSSSPPPRPHPSPVVNGRLSMSTTSATVAIRTATTTATSVAIKTEITDTPVMKQEALEAKRALLLADYGENLELLKECRKLIDDLQKNLGPEAVVVLQDKIQQRQAKIVDLEQRLQTYQTAAEMVEEKTADALLMKMEQIFERRIANAEEELSVVLEAAVTREKTLGEKADEAMKRYVEKHQEAIVAEERGSQAEFELLHQRNRIRELELQLQQLQGLSGLA